MVLLVPNTVDVFGGGNSGHSLYRERGVGGSSQAPVCICIGIEAGVGEVSMGQEDEIHRRRTSVDL